MSAHHPLTPALRARGGRHSSDIYTAHRLSFSGGSLRSPPIQLTLTARTSRGEERSPYAHPRAQRARGGRQLRHTHSSSAGAFQVAALARHPSTTHRAHVARQGALAIRSPPRSAREEAGSSDIYTAHQLVRLRWQHSLATHPTRIQHSPRARRAVSSAHHTLPPALCA